MASSWDIIQEYQDQNPDNPREAWRRARIARNQGDTSQGMADAEHYLWTQLYASKGLPQAIVGMGGPAIHHAKKQIHSLFGIPDASEPTPEQFRMGQVGAWTGLKKQLGLADLLRKDRQ